MFEMHDGAFHMVGLERAADAALTKIPSPHEMMNDQLAAAFEKVRQSHFALRRVEDIFLLHLDPWQLAALPRQLVAGLGELLLIRQVRRARSQPFLARDDFVWLHGS